MEQTSKKTIVSLKDIFIKFDGEVILNHINLDINEKEFVRKNFKNILGLLE